ncbi:MAG: cysteine dioxygenase family protein [Francisellaceae bacterium]|nr:cysteine dioxygenase family protein [Francisellaceae bacterium]MBT6208333.1 cysteine dioxygenase family protein [Francisellaceae bacterium]MBT6539381.1 cysteine dioxygenase family protein [Francisellaceae bacterium]
MKDLDELVKLLKKRIIGAQSVSSFVELLKNYEGNDWQNYLVYSTENYYRNIVYGCEDFDLIVISWDCMQRSKVHSHPSKGCLVKILSGALVESLYESNLDGKDLKIISTTEHQIGNVGYIDDIRGYHNIANTSEDQRAASLHLYSPGNYIPNYF